MVSASRIVDRRCATTTVVRPHHQPVQRILHDALALRVKRARRLVKKQDLRVLHNGPGNRHALLLAAGKLDAALA